MNTTPALNGSFSYQAIHVGHLLLSTVISVSVNLIIGTPLNTLVVWLILKGSRKFIASDFFFLNLAFSQFLFSLSGIWYIIFINLDVLFCALMYTFSLGLLFTTAPLFQCCICIECYVGVVHPVLYLRFKHLRYKLACCCAMWLISLGSCIYFVCTSANPLFMYGNSTLCIITFCVMTFCSLSVLRALKRPKPGDKDSGKNLSNAKKRKAFRIILLIMITMAINLLSFTATVPVHCCFELHKYHQILEICLNIALVTAFVQPLMYLHKSRKLPCMRKV